jgi:hypothetical protein
MRFQPGEFTAVTLNSYEESPCSPPAPGPVWRGVAIRMPQTAIFGTEAVADRAAAALPVCGYYLLDIADIPEDAALTLVARDISTGRIFSGPLIEHDPSPEAPPPAAAEAEPVDPAALKGLATGSYFNVNAFQFIALPVAAATYDVYVEYGRDRSNTVRVTLVPE